MEDRPAVRAFSGQQCNAGCEKVPEKNCSNSRYIRSFGSRRKQALPEIELVKMSPCCLEVIHPPHLLGLLDLYANVWVPGQLPLQYRSSSYLLQWHTEHKLLSAGNSCEKERLSVNIRKTAVHVIAWSTRADVCSCDVLFNRST